MMPRSFFSAFAFTALLVSSCLAENLQDVHPRLLLTPDDIAHARAHLGNPDYSQRVDQLAAKCKTAIAKWRKACPGSDRKDLKTLYAFGQTLHYQYMGDAIDLASLYALRPQPELAETAREMMLAAFGLRAVKNSWRDDGIHDAIMLDQWLRAYDLLTATGVFGPEDIAAIKDQLHGAGHFFEGWLLDGFNLGYADRRENGYCLNYHIECGYVLAQIAILYPDFPESARWLREARTQMIQQLFTEFGIDGAYGEGAMNYWHISASALLDMMIVARNNNIVDYFSDPAIVDAMTNTINWRMALTAPDGRAVALGDSDRDDFGAELFSQAGRWLDSPRFNWLARDCWNRGTISELEPGYYLLTYNPDAPCQQPQELFDVLRWSGYASFRSSWEPTANYFFMKWGTSFIGRRENQPDLIIPGHAHADALEFELHYHGTPILVDEGRTGVYGQTPIYGGYIKGTVERNTMGLGNIWGYSRLDGQYEQHVRDHGPSFLYEQPQKMIGRQDSHLVALGDTGAAAVVSAKVNIYSNITDQRTAFWFRDNGIVVLDDLLQSDAEQPYELYFNPPGKLIRNDSLLSFGCDGAKLDIARILPADAKIDICQEGDANLPPYYNGLQASFVRKNPWQHYSLVVLKEKARDAHYLNVLMPYTDQNAWQAESFGSQGSVVRSGADTIEVTTAKNSGVPLVPDSGVAVLRSNGSDIQTYLLEGGTELTDHGQPLVHVEVTSTGWAPIYSPIATVSVSLKDHRASVSLPLHPNDTQNMMWWPGGPKEGQVNQYPLTVGVSLRVDSAPTQVIGYRSTTDRPSDDFSQDNPGGTWPNDRDTDQHREKPLPFKYDAATQMLTVTLDGGINQIIWQ
jgi:hypothetical protein